MLGLGCEDASSNEHIVVVVVVVAAAAAAVVVMPILRMIQVHRRRDRDDSATVYGSGFELRAGAGPL